MSIDTQLRTTTPTDLPPVDHDRLQRVGRRRRRTTRLASGSAVAIVVAGAGFGLAHLAATDDTPSMLGGGDGADATTPDASDASDEPTTEPTDQPDEPEAGSTDEPEVGDPAADADVVADFSDLTHDQAVARLEERLAASPERPADLVSISVHEVVDGDEQVEELRGDETWEEFPVIAVNHPDFDPTSGFETPAVQPTWDQQSAELALAALAGQREFAGVAVDALGRTVVVFASGTSNQFVHVDPASGYTSGIVFGADEWSPAEEEYHRADEADPDGYLREDPAGP